MKKWIDILLGFGLMVILSGGLLYYTKEMDKRFLSKVFELEKVKEEFVTSIKTIESLEATIGSLEEEVQLRQDITSLIVDAGRSYNVSPMLLAQLIKSESNFRPEPNHKLPQVVGSGGINTKANPKTRNNPHSYVGGIYASSERLNREIEKHSNLYNAIIGYKGFNLQGREQADKIYTEYVKYLKGAVDEK